jgi:hypothetical protein
MASVAGASCADLCVRGRPLGLYFDHRGNGLARSRLRGATAELVSGLSLGRRRNESARSAARPGSSHAETATTATPRIDSPLPLRLTGMSDSPDTRATPGVDSPVPATPVSTRGTGDSPYRLAGTTATSRIDAPESLTLSGVWIRGVEPFRRVDTGSRTCPARRYGKWSAGTPGHVVAPGALRIAGDSEVIGLRPATHAGVNGWAGHKVDMRNERPRPSTDKPVEPSPMDGPL